MSKPDGGPIHPFKLSVPDITNPETGGIIAWRYENHPGMSLRDYFAANALACVPEMWKGKAHVSAKLAYDIADAMLEARDK